MTDVMFERFAVLAEDGNGNWSDVRRRARGARLRVVVPAASVAAAIAAAAALAATGGWMFSTHDRHVTAETHVALRGRTWNVSVTTIGQRRVCFSVSPAGSPSPRWNSCVGGSKKRLATPFGAMPLDVSGGQIWVGVVIGFARRIAITDVAGSVHSTKTVAAPHGTKSPFRYWAIALTTKARSITAYGAHGRSIRKKLP